MWAYLLKRLLLMIPTLIGILLITFTIIQFVPGGPVEQMVSQMQGRDAGGEAGAAPSESSYRGRQGVDAAKIEEIKKLYGFDKPAHERFFQMLGQFARFDPGQKFFSQQGRVVVDQREIAGVDHARAMDISPHLLDIDSLGHCQGSARGHAI